jgi:hypothetical protein
MESLVILHLSFNTKRHKTFLVMENGKWKMENDTNGVCV